MKLFRFSRNRKERDAPAVETAIRLIHKNEDDFLAQAIAPRDSVQLARDFLDGYPLTRKYGPESIYAITRDDLDKALDSSPFQEIPLQLRKRQVSLFFKIKLAYADIEDDQKVRTGYTDQIHQAFGQLIDAFSGRREN